MRSAGSRGRNSPSTDGTCKQRKSDKLKGERGEEGTRALSLARKFQRETAGFHSISRHAFLKIEVSKLRQQDYECFHFVSSSLYQWHEQGWNTCQKHEICRVPFFYLPFFFSSLQNRKSAPRISELKHKKEWFVQSWLEHANEASRWKYLHMTSQRASSVPFPFKICPLSQMNQLKNPHNRWLRTVSQMNQLKNPHQRWYENPVAEDPADQLSSQVI